MTALILTIQIISIIALIAIALAYYFGYKRANASAEKFWKQALQTTIESMREFQKETEKTTEN